MRKYAQVWKKSEICAKYAQIWAAHIPPPPQQPPPDGMGGWPWPGINDQLRRGGPDILQKLW